MVRHFLNQLTNNDFCIFENLYVYPTVSPYVSGCVWTFRCG